MKLPCFPKTLRLLLLGTSVTAIAMAQQKYTTPYFFSTFAGVTSIGTADGQRSAARFYRPGGVATDNAGNAFIADTYNHTIRKVTPDGVVTTFAGKPGISGSLDGTGGAARFSSPRGLAVDASGNLFVADSGNSTVRKVTPGGVVTTFAGVAGERGTSDGTGTSARFETPCGLTLSVDGNLYVADDSGDAEVSYSRREATGSLIRKISPAGVVTTFATSLGTDYYSSSNGTNKPSLQAITSDANGNVFVASTSGTHQVYSNLIDVTQEIYRFTPSGVRSNLFTVIASDSREPSLAGASGFVSDLLIDRTGKLLVVENNQISQYDLNTPSAPPEPVLINLGIPGLNGKPQRIQGAIKLAIDRNGNFFIASTNENAMWRVSSSLVEVTPIGQPASEVRRTLDGPTSSARFTDAAYLCTDRMGNTYVTDTDDCVVRKISAEGAVTTLAGLAGSPSFANGTGSMARFSKPSGIAVDATGQLYVADYFNRRIRKISPTGEVTNFSGSDSYDGWDGPASTASFRELGDLTIDAAGNLYVIDGSRIRKISPTGTVSTLAGDPYATGMADGPGALARFDTPLGLTVDAAGNIFVADSGNDAIRRISPTGDVTTIARGSIQSPGITDGTVATATFSSPSDVGVAANGDLFVVERFSRSIRRITSGGDVSTVAGSAGLETNADGLGEIARFGYPFQIAIDSRGYLLVVNSTAISLGQLAGPPVISTQPQSLTVVDGNSAQFSVTAGGTPEPTYQWYFKGGAFSGATSKTLSFSTVRSADAGEYTVVVTNELGKVTSNKATLTVASTPTINPDASGGSGGGGGGGSIEPWFALALLVFGTARARKLLSRAD